MWICRTLAEGLQKDKLPGLPVFTTALRCLPYVLPDSWDAARIATELPGRSPLAFFPPDNSLSPMSIIIQQD